MRDVEISLLDQRGRRVTIREHGAISTQSSSTHHQLWEASAIRLGCLWCWAITIPCTNWHMHSHVASEPIHGGSRLDQNNWIFRWRSTHFQLHQCCSIWCFWRHGQRCNWILFERWWHRRWTPLQWPVHGPNTGASWHFWTAQQDHFGQERWCLVCVGNYVNLWNPLLTQGIWKTVEMWSPSWPMLKRTTCHGFCFGRRWEWTSRPSWSWWRTDRCWNPSTGGWCWDWRSRYWPRQCWSWSSRCWHTRENHGCACPRGQNHSEWCGADSSEHFGVASTGTDFLWAFNFRWEGQMLQQVDQSPKEDGTGSSALCSQTCRGYDATWCPSTTTSWASFSERSRQASHMFPMNLGALLALVSGLEQIDIWEMTAHMQVLLPQFPLVSAIQRAFLRATSLKMWNLWCVWSWYVPKRGTSTVLQSSTRTSLTWWWESWSPSASSLGTLTSLSWLTMSLLWDSWCAWQWTHDWRWDCPRVQQLHQRIHMATFLWKMP